MAEIFNMRTHSHTKPSSTSLFNTGIEKHSLLLSSNRYIKKFLMEKEIIMNYNLLVLPLVDLPLVNISSTYLYMQYILESSATNTQNLGFVTNHTLLASRWSSTACSINFFTLYLSSFLICIMKISASYRFPV